MMEIRLNCGVGDKASFSKTISESDVYLFAGITGDLNPLHINSVIAEQGFAGKRIVHGALLNGMLSAVIGMKLPGEGTIYLEQSSRFLKPVYIGDTVCAVVEVAEILNPVKGIVKLSTSVYNQKEELALSGFAVVKAPQYADG